MPEFYTVGKIVNTQGLRGEVRVISSTDFAEERYQKGNTLVLFRQGHAPLELVVASHRKHKNFDLLSFEGYPSINDVEAFRDGKLKISSDQQQALEEHAYYYHEIIGLEIITTTGEVIGKVVEILSPGANDVWVVKGTTKKHYYIPYIEPVVKEVDVAKKRATIEVIEGLLD